MYECVCLYMCLYICQYNHFNQDRGSPKNGNLVLFPRVQPMTFLSPLHLFFLEF